MCLNLNFRPTESIQVRRKRYPLRLHGLPLVPRWQRARPGKEMSHTRHHQGHDHGPNPAEMSERHGGRSSGYSYLPRGPGGKKRRFHDQRSRFLTENYVATLKPAPSVLRLYHQRPSQAKVRAYPERAGPCGIWLFRIFPPLRMANDRSKNVRQRICPVSKYCLGKTTVKCRRDVFGLKILSVIVPHTLKDTLQNWYNYVVFFC